MARVTVEDCIGKVDNRFELVLLAAHRAKQLSKGVQLTLKRDGDKNPVLALREIAAGTVSAADLKEDLIHSLQSHMEAEDPQVIDAKLLTNEGKKEANCSDEITFEKFTEEQLLENMSKLSPPQKKDDF